MWYLSFWFGLFSMVFKVHPRCVPSVRIPFFSRLSDARLCTRHISIHSPGDGHLRCSYRLATVNSAAMTTAVYLFEPLLSTLLGSIHRSGAGGSYGNSEFNFLGQTVLCTGCTILHSHQDSTKVLISPHPHIRSFLFFFNNSHPNG